ncbi:MAG: sel1 repeat family protein [Rhodocyclaceae bacterium]|nr:sel1 repeat family protein [Rhodocyclaceae bacterium]
MDCMMRPLKGFMLLLALLAATGCAQPQPRQTVQICDTSGCNERPRNYAPERKAEELADPRVLALEDVAKKDPRAAYDLGLRYFRGDGVRQDSYQALTWMRDAAERGELSAQKALGRFYLTGLEEMGSDPAEAEKWLTIAAGRGDKEASKLLAEASAAKKSDQEYWKWTQRWRPVFYRYWYSGYAYLGYWRAGYWYYH